MVHTPVHQSSYTSRKAAHCNQPQIECGEYQTGREILAEGTQCEVLHQACHLHSKGRCIKWSCKLLARAAAAMSAVPHASRGFSSGTGLGAYPMHLS